MVIGGLILQGPVAHDAGPHAPTVPVGAYFRLPKTDGILHGIAIGKSSTI